MKEAWLFQGAVVPVDTETTQALVAEIKRLIDVVGGMALAQRTWVGLTYEDMVALQKDLYDAKGESVLPTTFAMAVEAKLKEKNS
jgi:hypothetical protein